MRLVDRDGQCEALAALLEGAAGGCGGAVLLRGAPGHGKTALLGRLVALAEAAGFRCLVVEADALPEVAEVAAEVADGGGALLVAVDDAGGADVGALLDLAAWARRAPAVLALTDLPRLPDDDPLGAVARTPGALVLDLPPLRAETTAALLDGTPWPVTGGNPALVRGLARDLAAGEAGPGAAYRAALAGVLDRCGAEVAAVAHASAVLAVLPAGPAAALPGGLLPGAALPHGALPAAARPGVVCPDTALPGGALPDGGARPLASGAAGVRQGGVVPLAPGRTGASPGGAEPLLLGPASGVGGDPAGGDGTSASGRMAADHVVPGGARLRAPSGPAAPVDLVADLLGRAPASVADARARLVGAGLDRADPAAVLDVLPAARRAELHLRAARTLHERGESPAAVADHLVTAGLPAPAWAVDVLVAAADHALAADDVPTAVDRLAAAHRRDEADPPRGVHPRGVPDPAVAARRCGCADRTAAPADRRTSPEPTALSEPAAVVGPALTARLARARWQLNPAAALCHLDPLADALAADPAALAPRDAAALVRQLVWHGRTAAAGRVLAALRAREHAAELPDLETWLSLACPPLAASRRTAFSHTAFSHSAARHGSALHPNALHPNALHPGALHPNAPHTSASRTAAHQRGTPHPAALNPTTPPSSRVDPWLREAASLVGGFVLGDQRRAAAEAAHYLRHAQLSHTSPWSEEPALLALLALVRADRAVEADRACARLLDEARSRRAPTWVASFAAAASVIALRLGDLAGAAGHARAALDAVPAHGWGAGVGLPLGSLILADTLRGRRREAGRHVTAPVPDALFDGPAAPHYLHARGHHHLASGRDHAALADFLACGDLLRSWGLDLPGLAPWRTGAAEAWTRLGNHDRARRLVFDQLATTGADAGRPRALALRALAPLSPPTRRPHLLAEAADALERCGDRYELAATLACLGAAHHALGDHRRARAVLRRAWHLARACGARPLCARLEPDAADPVAHDTSGLTGSERKVAALAVTGLTNRQIAEKLFVTPSTVEQHLTRVFRKLRVTHRTDLPTTLHADLTTPA
ncbi:AAA family ATPase [Actinosynnema pretiosum subsp. pretiosum]|uniref:AAA family ATPase n=1 Tax=Actinosynnema pretiosum subsp. pretiosum TaxID=103721 RepID=A0A1U9Y7Q1_9PSEU|nr:LuxR-family transcriptional regulator [Actinosynnema pretiosum subsp. pretiosum]AXX30573.1 regulatory protein, LuxR [Actinosynnema pretiosum subsp. pretiosum]QUF05290.1 AAA family ATPase [Actinosynnema pretiosum subsp. pretiosum]